MLKFDHERRAAFELERSDFRAHYENVAVRKLLAILLSIRRLWLIVATAVTLALALAFLLLPLLPRKYSATALVYPKLFSSAQEKSVARGSIEATAIVAGEARLMLSDTILQAVVKRLALAPVDAKSSSWAAQGMEWLRFLFLPEAQNHSAFDRTVAMLRSKVTVVPEARSYLIAISFSAPSADEAARVVNTFAIEYLREKSTQSIKDVVTTAEAELARQLAINGEKHPKVLQAAGELSGARAALKAAEHAEGDGRDTIVADEGVTLGAMLQTARPRAPRAFTILTGYSILGLAVRASA